MRDARDGLIRETSSVCPECFGEIGARVVERESGVYLEKECPRHGAFSLLLSSAPGYYRALDDYYFAVMRRQHRQNDFILHLTARCNLRCPICLAGVGSRDEGDFPADRLQEFLSTRTDAKIDLMGAEPTMRDDLPAIVRMIRESGNIAALHTNGLRLAEPGYLEALQEAGLDEVHLQFDGFDDGVYRELRGEPLLERKLAALEALERLSVPTDLVVTVARGVNEREIGPVLAYGARHRFVREVFFLGCRYLGNARSLPVERCMMPDELIDIVEDQTDGMISRERMFRFQKLYFAFLSAFGVRKCLYIHHYLLMRGRKGEEVFPVDDVLDLRSTERSLDAFARRRAAGRRTAVPFLFAALAMDMLTSKRLLGKLRDLASYVLPFAKGFNLAKLSENTVLIGFITACDAYSLDTQIAANCGKGAISLERGIRDEGAIDNVMRDRLTAEKR